MPSESNALFPVHVNSRDAPLRDRANMKIKRVLHYLQLIPAHAWAISRNRGPTECVRLFATFLVPFCLFRLSFALPSDKFAYSTKIAFLRKIALLVGVLLAFCLGLIFVPVFWAALMALSFGLFTTIWQRVRLWQEANALLALARKLTEEAKPNLSDNAFTTLDQMGLAPETTVAICKAQNQCRGEDLVIGHIDAKGRVLGCFGDIPGRLSATKQTFIKRARNPVDIILCGKNVLVRKQMTYNRIAFAREWFALAHFLINSKVRVPRLYKGDEATCSLYMNYIPGRMMNSIAPSFEGQRRLVPQYFSEAFLAELERQYDEVHRCGIAGLDVGFGNIVEDSKTGQPVLIDFEVSRYFASRHTFGFASARDRDRLNINYVYERNLLTEQSANAELLVHRRNRSGWYAPLDFGLGLAVPGFWSVDVGTGRWEHFNGPIISPLVKGKRILDLGSNNGSMPMMMLRSGAKEVLCVEQQDKFIKQGGLVLRLFEWRDIDSYNLRYHQGNMLEILEASWGDFDIITAYCSLYHLSEEDMRRVVRRASELSPMMILQGNLHDRQQKKCSTEFLKMVLEGNGYPVVEVHAPKNYARPLLIGRRCASREIDETEIVDSSASTISFGDLRQLQSVG